MARHLEVFFDTASDQGAIPTDPISPEVPFPQISNRKQLFDWYGSIQEGEYRVDVNLILACLEGRRLDLSGIREVIIEKYAFQATLELANKILNHSFLFRSMKWKVVVKDNTVSTQDSNLLKNGYRDFSSEDGWVVGAEFSSLPVGYSYVEVNPRFGVSQTQVNRRPEIISIEEVDEFEGTHMMLSG